MYTLGYVITLVIIPLCVTIQLLLIILQCKSYLFLAKQVEHNLFSNKTRLFCIFGQYTAGGLCAMLCFLMHISHSIFPHYICKYGMGVCLAFYGASKSCLYGFLVERAKATQGMTKLLPNYVWQYVFPIYISCYLLVSVIVVNITSRATMVHPIDEVTSCVLYEYQPYMVACNAVVDLFNSILFLCLFIYPIYQLSKENEENTKDFGDTIKWNAICSSISTMSSITVTTLFLFLNNYVYLLGGIDMMINSICSFSMLGCNRQYFRHLFYSSV